MIKTMQIQDCLIGDRQPCFIVAEISANHNQDLKRAKKIIQTAKCAGADAIKLQTYLPSTLTINCDTEWFQISTANRLWGGKTLFELYEEAYTPWDWHEELFSVAKDENLICFSTPFDETAISLLEGLNVPAYKVASFELVDLPLLRKIAKTGKPVIMSTGMASLSEIEEAVKTLREYGTSELALLKCTSAYPASPQSMNLKTIPHLRETFNVLSGLSDHTLSNAVAIASVALGASIIEKHFTLARSDGGPDSAFSLEPDEFAKMVKEIREAELALGCITYERTHEDLKSISFRRSLFVVEDICEGDIFTETNVRSIRPGQGLAPRYLDVILGKKATQTIKRGTPLSWEIIGN